MPSSTTFDPTAVGAVDAAGTGMGGVWYVEPGTLPRPPDHKPYDQLQLLANSDATTLPRSSSSDTAPQAAPTAATGPAPVVWRQPFPLSIQQQLLSFANPTGTVTNSDLELAGVITHQDVLAQHFDIRESTTATICDNTPAVFWSRKESTTTLKAPAYLLRLSSLHQRFHRYHSEISHIPGVVNQMADDCSRLWNLVTHNCLLISISTTYCSHGLGACVPLVPKPSKPESFLAVPPPQTQFGVSGNASVFPSVPTILSLAAPIMLQFFAQHYRDGRIAPSKKQVRFRTVEDAVRSMGLGFSRLRAQDPCPTTSGSIDFRLQRQLAGYAKTDSLARVKPIPLSIVMCCLRIACATATISNCAVADMICLAFFFLCRPGEYSVSPKQEFCPFLLENVSCAVQASTPSAQSQNLARSFLRMSTLCG
jgi:hypothetical protein